jgi:hypothetical protein
MHLKGESQKILEYFLGSWKINSVLSVGPLMGFYIYLFRKIKKLHVNIFL